MELGRYRLDEQVGQGGMAVVWRGWDTQLRRTVAVKVLHPHLHAREEIRRRFDREAQAVARLHHPHILDVYDFSGLEAQPSYLVTEFIRGQNLRAFAEAHRFDPPELAAICLLPIAEALAHAHAAGVVHRDLKPENIMVREDGVVKLTDFGIAALLDPDDRFTATGTILGSPAHLAPETIEGKPAEPRSDLFSFGTILYWLSCGELPYQAPSPAALLRKILEGKHRDVRLVRPSVGDAQARLIDRCLENDPALRPQSALELHAELARVVTGEGVEEPAALLARYVRAPEQEAERLRTLLVAGALGRGREAARGRHIAVALGAFGRALALDPSNAEARGQVERIRKRELLLRAVRRGALAVVALGCALALALGARSAVRTFAARRAAAAPPAATAASSARKTAPAPPAASVAASGAGREAAGQPAPRRAPRSPAPSPPQPPPKLHVRLHPKFGADVSVDGHDLGYKPMFEVELAPGPHRAVVRHKCCEDGTEEFVVKADRPDQIYKLRYGQPRPARLRVVNAPAGARVLVDGVLAGTAPEPAPVAMGEPDREVTVTVGDRVLSTKLKAGDLNDIDYARAQP